LGAIAFSIFLVLSLSNPALQLSFDVNTARWSLRPRSAETPFVEDVRCGASLRGPRGRVRWEGALLDVNAGVLDPVESVHGRLKVLRVIGRMASQGRKRTALGLRVTLEFALPEARPFLVWRIKVRNEGGQDFRLESVTMASVGPHFSQRRWNAWEWLMAREGERPDIPSGAVRLHGAPGQLSFFSNGYQSWSFTGALQAGMRQPASIFGPLGDPKQYNLLSPVVNRPGHFTSDMFAALGDGAHNSGLVIGWIAQREQFGHIEADLDRYAPSLKLVAQGDDVRIAPGEERITDWAYLHFISLEERDPLGEYLEAVARENRARVPQSAPAGWCSWYHYFDRVTERDLLDNLTAIEKMRARLPLDLVQLDDGYQGQVGDWFETKPTFPHGLAWLTKEIRAHGSTPGLWLAPYIVRSDARINRQHPDWFIRNSFRLKANAGYNWFRWCYGLDPTHPGVRDHTRRLIETAVNQWGFPYLKLDFLYAAALPGQRYDSSMTRAQAMRLALADIREAAGDETILLGCGCPLGPAVGLVDGMRIGTDVAPTWHPELFSPRFNAFVRNELAFVSARNAIRNIINRAPLHRRWWLNDPDCLLVRDHDSKLTEAEVRSLATAIALSGGMFLVSDDMTRLSPGRERYITSLLPVISEGGARACAWFSQSMPDTLTLPLRGAVGEWLVAGIFNWDEAPRQRTLDISALGFAEGAYYVADFWESTLTTLQPGQPLEFRDIPPHGAHLIALRPATRGPALASSSFHFSQGQEITAWEASANELKLKIKLGRVAEGKLVLALPAAPRAVTFEGQDLETVEAGPGLFSLNFTVNRAAEVRVVW
jgi:alpha-galactosidase